MKTDPLLIAPCGMNCSICLGFLRDKNKCVGCRLIKETMYKSIKQCIIRNCELLAETKSKFCYECGKYPCRRLKQLDKRYRTKYSMSMIENLEFIKVKGLKKFLVKEEVRWRCESCGGPICVHRGYCLQCGKK